VDRRYNLVQDTAMLTDNDRKSWAPLPEVVAWVGSLVAGGARVLEIGPGSVPFPQATDFVDWKSGDRVTACDLNREPLPYPDKSFDFVYCRHVLEDLYDPFRVCDEMSRVARAGFIETPSPLAEFCKGVDGSSPAWRGYHHHRYFVWDQDGVLTFLGKYPLVEHLGGSNEEAVERALRADPFVWNTYFPWNERVRWRHLQHDVDFGLGPEYGSLIASALTATLSNTTIAKRHFGGSRPENDRVTPPTRPARGR
jgi:hypothetical protein